MPDERRELFRVQLPETDESIDARKRIDADQRDSLRVRLKAALHSAVGRSVSGPPSRSSVRIRQQLIEQIVLEPEHDLVEAADLGHRAIERRRAPARVSSSAVVERPRQKSRAHVVPGVAVDARRRAVVKHVACDRHRDRSERSAAVSCGAVAVGDVQSAHATMVSWFEGSRFEVSGSMVPMHSIQPARLKPGVAAESIRGAAPRARPRATGRTPDDSRQRADLLGSQSSRADEEARRDRHRSDHAGRRLRLREPRHARRALEGGRVPLPDARLPRARASRRDVRRSPAIASRSDRRAR